jgi:hypothetical protein
MLIDKNGIVSPEQVDAQKREASEAKRIRGFSDDELSGEIRHQMRTTGKTNHLTFACGLTLGRHTGKDQGLFAGNDPYRLAYAGRRPKMGRQRGKASAPKVAAS